MATLVPIAAALISTVGGVLLAPRMPSMPSAPALPPPPPMTTMPETPPVLQADVTPAPDTNSALLAEQDRQRSIRRQATSYNQGGLLSSDSTSKKTLLGE